MPRSIEAELDRMNDVQRALLAALRDALQSPRQRCVLDGLVYSPKAYRKVLAAQLEELRHYMALEIQAMLDALHMHMAREWQFPDDPFVVYETSDESWARALGIGREVVRRTPS